MEGIPAPPKKYGTGSLFELRDAQLESWDVEAKKCSPMLINPGHGWAGNDGNSNVDFVIEMPGKKHQ